MLRSLALAVAVLFLAPAASQAVFGEEIVPYAGEADGVTVDTAGRTPVARFARTEAASHIWRRIAGRRTSVSCNLPGGQAAVQRSRRERGRAVRLVSEATDVCTISTRRRGNGNRCFRDESRGWCIRAVVALSDAGRRHVERAIATWDLIVVGFAGATIGDEPRDFGPLEEAMGDRLVRLAGPSSTPPPGTIGLWERAPNSDDIAVVTLSASGERLFFSTIGGVYSTNARDMLSPDGPSLFP